VIININLLSLFWYHRRGHLFAVRFMGDPDHERRSHLRKRVEDGLEFRRRHVSALGLNHLAAAAVEVNEASLHVP
jgi:hypothetical protein